MRTPYTDDGTWEFDAATGGYVQRGVPALLTTTPSGGVAIAGYEFQPRAGGGIATRIPSGSIDQLTNQLGNTFSVGFRLADSFDAIRIIYMNLGTTQTVNMTCAVSVANDLSSPNNSSGTWVNGTIANSAVRVSATEPSINFSSWMSIAGDAGIGYARLYIPSAGNTECGVATFYANSQADGSAWAAMPGDEWICIKQAGDQITAPTGFTATSTNSFSAIAGIQYRSRGVVRTITAFGDSIMYGAKATASGDAFWAKAIRALKVAGVKVEACNMARGGQTTQQYYPRVANTLILIKPDVVIYGAFSPNDSSGIAPTAATILAQRVELSTVRDDCKVAGALLLPMTGMPKGSGAYNVSAYTNAQDDLRKSLNATVRALPVYLDLDSVMSNSTATGTASYFANSSVIYSDFIHPSEAGNVAVEPEALRAIKQALVLA